MHRKRILGLDKGLLVKLCAHATERATEILQVGTTTSCVIINFLKVKICGGNKYRRKSSFL